MCALCVRGTRFRPGPLTIEAAARAPPGAAGPHRAFAGFGPRGPFALAFGVRAVSAVSGPGPAAAGELAAFSYPRVHVDTHSSNPCVRVVTQCNDA